METADGDKLVIHENTPERWQAGDRIAIMVHGLCGDHNSQYMMRVCTKLMDRGIKVIRIDMRGFGDSRLVSRGHMHAGRSDDLLSVLNDTNRRNPDSPITIIGFSLGGNIALKLLCELNDHPKGALDSAVVISPPIDLLKCTLNLQKGVNQFYNRYFAKLLSKAVRDRRKSGVPFDDVPLKTLPKKLFDFDDQYTAPAGGFEDAEDYYARCSTHQLLQQISIPTLLIAAKDDPIVPFEMYEQLSSPSIQMLFAAGGGHLGFISGKSSDADSRWMDWRIVEWIESLPNPISS